MQTDLDLLIDKVRVFTRPHHHIAQILAEQMRSHDTDEGLVILLYGAPGVGKKTTVGKLLLYLSLMELEDPLHLLLDRRSTRLHLAYTLPGDL